MQTAPNLALIGPRALLIGVVRYLSLVLSELPAAIRRQGTLLALIALYWICGSIIGRLAGMPPANTITTYLPTFVVLVPMMAVALLILRAVIIMAIERPARPLSQLAREFATRLATPRCVARALPILAGMLVFGGTFTVMKASIPFLAPYAWDEAFAQLDKSLHGGTAPWELLQPLLGEPVITNAINWAYNLWFYFFGLIWVWQSFSQRDERLRSRFFFALVLGWILLGNVAATLFSSAGPCFFGRVTGLPDPFLPLVDYLHQTNRIYPIWALTAQDMLWQNYSMRTVELGAGISAMPSMHVAMATLFALVCWRTKRWLGIVMTVYAVIIMIGSVHLAWHYAIDGYAGALGMLLIWWGMGRALERWGDARAGDPAAA